MPRPTVVSDSHVLRPCPPNVRHFGGMIQSGDGAFSSHTSIHPRQPEPMNLNDKVAIVTGASSGLGDHFSRALIERGAIVYGLARSEDKLKRLHDALGDRFHPIVCDVREEDQVQTAVGHVIEEEGRVDVLVNNAGLGQFGPVASQTLAQWDLQMETNLRGVFLCTRAVLPAMKKWMSSRFEYALQTSFSLT